MARATRDARLETRTARGKLPKGVYHWRGIRKGLALGYRKGPNAATWTVRLVAGPNRYVTKALGNADDHQDANGADVLDYYQAQEAARAFADDHASGKIGAPYTVAEATRDYLEWFQANRKSYRETELTVQVHILPALGDRPVADLTTPELRKWHEGLAAAPARLRSKEGKPLNIREATDPRPRKATANRILTVLKAALNHAWRDGHVPTDEAWRRVKPFRHVDTPKVHHLDRAECIRLLNACAPDFRQMVKAALLTGCRYGELGALEVRDFHPDAGTVDVRHTKNGKPRHVPLTDEGRAFFAGLTAGRPRTDRLFVKADGTPWGKSHQNRPLRMACEAAGLEPIGFHVLRHSYGSALAMRGVPLQVIAEVLGHADTRITSRHYAHLMPSYVADTVRAHLPTFGGEEPAKVVALKPKAAAR